MRPITRSALRHPIQTSLGAGFALFVWGYVALQLDLWFCIAEWALMSCFVWFGWREGGWFRRREERIHRLLTDADKRPGQPVGWEPATEDALQSESELALGQPGKIDSCVGEHARFESGRLPVVWYQRTGSVPAYYQDEDLEVITEGEYAQRTGRVDRGKPPVGETT